MGVQLKIYFILLSATYNFFSTKNFKSEERKTEYFEYSSSECYFTGLKLLQTRQTIFRTARLPTIKYNFFDYHF